MADGEAYPYEVVMPAGEDSDMPYTDDPDIRYDMTRAIIFPLEDSWVPASMTGEPVSTRTILIYRYKNKEWREDLIAQ